MTFASLNFLVCREMDYFSYSLWWCWDFTLIFFSCLLSCIHLRSCSLWLYFLTISYCCIKSSLTSLKAWPLSWLTWSMASCCLSDIKGLSLNALEEWVVTNSSALESIFSNLECIFYFSLWRLLCIKRSKKLFSLSLLIIFLCYVTAFWYALFSSIVFI